MKSKVITGLVLTLFLASLLTITFTIQPVKAEPGTIYIRADGSVDPDTAPISSVDNVTYTFTDNIYTEIFVERDNIVVDGAGYTLHGPGPYIYSRGIRAQTRNNITIKNMEIGAFYYGIYLGNSLNNTVSGNSITNNSYGIYLYWSSNNTVSGNSITNNDDGITLYKSSNNTIYHNNFVDNTGQVYIYESTNVWDGGYPSGGNYWSDYTDVDVKSGPNQDEPSSDGVGDTPYVIDGNNKDNYPLMGMFSDFPVTYQEKTYDVTTICNSTISGFHFDHANIIIDFDVTGPEGTTGFCRIMIPRILMEGPYTVLVDGEEITYTELPISNSTHAFLYFTYSHSTHHIIITAAPPVGGLGISPNQLGLLTPYINLTLAVLLATAATAAFLRYRKKQ